MRMGPGSAKAFKASYDDDEDLNNFEDDEFSIEDDEEVDSDEEADSELEGGSEDGKTRDDDDELKDSGRLRLRAGIVLDSDSYAGKKGSRKSSLEEDDEEDEEDGSDDIAELNESLEAANGRVSSVDEEEEYDEEEPSKAHLILGQDDELEALSREYEKIREEEAKGIEIFRRQEKADHRKGLAVQDQKNLWDRGLEIRISLQKVLGSANRLPRERAKGVLCQENEKVKKAYESLTDAAVRTLNCLLDLESAVIEKNDSIVDSYSGNLKENGKREATELGEREGEGDGPSDKAWERLDQMYSKIVPYRDSALDRWQRKTQIYTGAVTKVRLRAFNQNVSQQVASSLRDASRFISRTRLQRNSVHVLGEPPVNAVKENLTINLEEAAKASSVNEVEDELDPETFDDSEFYQQLLHEFLESSDPNALSSLYATSQHRTKKRKQVDRRASKGRKLRYTAFEPLINFMAPKPMVLPPMATHLFKNLFGQKRRIVPDAS